jgi:hypothetical protein
MGQRLKGMGATRRHHLLNLTSHELGHALGMGHSGDDSSLMDGGKVGWFVWGVEEPTVTDLYRFYLLYPELKHGRY